MPELPVLKALALELRERLPGFVVECDSELLLIHPATDIGLGDMSDPAAMLQLLVGVPAIIHYYPDRGLLALRAKDGRPLKEFELARHGAVDEIIDDILNYCNMRT